MVMYMHGEWIMLEDKIEEKVQEFLCGIIEGKENRDVLVNGLKNKVVNVFLQMVNNDKEVPILQWIIKKFNVRKTYEIDMIILRII